MACLTDSLQNAAYSPRSNRDRRSRKVWMADVGRSVPAPVVGMSVSIAARKRKTAVQRVIEVFSLLFAAAHMVFDNESRISWWTRWGMCLTRGILLQNNSGGEGMFVVGADGCVFCTSKASWRVGASESCSAVSHRGSVTSALGVRSNLEFSSGACGSTSS